MLDLSPKTLALMALRRMIDGVAGNLDHQIGAPHAGLTGQPGFGLQTPGLVEVILLQLIRLFQRVKALSNNDMASCAGTGHLAGMLNINVIAQQRFADSLALLRLNNGTFRANFVVR